MEPRGSRHGLSMSLPKHSSRGHTEPASSTSSQIYQCRCSVSAQGNPLKTRRPRFLLGAGHIDTKPQLLKYHSPRRKQVFSAPRGQNNLINIGNISKVKFLNTSKQAILVIVTSVLLLLTPSWGGPKAESRNRKVRVTAVRPLS